MNILLVAATEPEITPVLDTLEQFHWVRPNFGMGYGFGHDISVLITRIGMVNTAISVTEILIDKSFDLVIHLGIAGTFYPKIYSIGSIVEIQYDTFVELGAEDNNQQILNLEMLGFELLNLNQKSYYNTLQNPFVSLSEVPKVYGATVNLASGTTETIAKRLKHNNIQVETMESAALFQVCLQYNQKFVSFRAISNAVEPRDKSKWNIPLALQNLSRFILDFLQNEDYFYGQSNFNYQ